MYLPDLTEIFFQNPLDIIISPCVGIFYPDQFKAVCSADVFLLPVPAAHKLFFLMLFSVQFHRQYRHLFSAEPPLIDHKVEAPVKKQTLVRYVLLKHLRDGNFFPDSAPFSVIEDIVKGMVQADKERLLCLCTVRLDPQRAGMNFIGSYMSYPVCPYILRQFVHVILLILIVEPF